MAVYTSFTPIIRRQVETISMREYDVLTGEYESTLDSNPSIDLRLFIVYLRWFRSVSSEIVTLMLEVDLGGCPPPRFIFV